MDLERSPPPETAAAGGGGAASCSICLDPVVAGGRSVARLQCRHEFHLGQISPPARAPGRASLGE
ncbi:hypothetical protein E2562_026243 [Oryza meyeriana var. granulata]|uniref:RING-type domain-containing protein n=1 Tax=Oryza meyeriana var. granulata TaxID=110450 RepID=A0A6G1CIV8_9ORYZ|nr:hypothetical protein E2562_026243 [Oryza meyeriana var. granulata]